MRTDLFGPALQQFEVTGANPYRWDQPLSFGSWITEHDDTGTFSAGLPVWNVEVRGRYQSRTLRLNNGISGECRGLGIEISYRNLTLDPTLGFLPVLQCRYNGNLPFQFSLQADAFGRLRGDFLLEGRAYQIVSEHRLQDSVLTSTYPAGFVVTSNNQPVWAVETINRGRVMTLQALPERHQDALAAISFALLLTDFEAMDSVFDQD